MRGDPQVETDIVLIGGGHAHVHVLRAFAMRPEAGVRVTLVARDLKTPYSGMLPGVVAGLYTLDEAHIDLVRLAAATGTRLIHGEAIGIDRGEQRVQLAGRPPIAYDLLSVDVGITPALAAISGAEQHAITVKPIGAFIEKFEGLLASIRAPEGPRRIAVVGGGAGGVELLLSVRTRILAGAAAAAEGFSFALVTADEILATHGRRVSAAFRRILEGRGVALHEKCMVAAVRPGAIVLADEREIAADAVLVTTDAAPPPWFAQTGLARDEGGFLAVGPTLQSLDDPDVFAAGDCAGLVETPREKSGVFAVRAGPWLADNLRRRAHGETPRPWRPQRRHLALISTGERNAVLSWGGVAAAAPALWRLKDVIDRRWMRQYQDVEAILTKMAQRNSPGAATGVSPDAMRCGGCAAKVGPGPLSRALARLGPLPGAAVLVGLEVPDDAAIVVPSPGRHLVQTVDVLRAFVDDDFVFGEIAAAHSLNDVFAMGGVPRHALAVAGIPPGPKTEETLFQLLAGARACLDREGVALAGGHSAEAADVTFGLSVTGEVAPDGILRKGGLKAGDALVLTRPIGTGILFAAAMRGKADAHDIAAAIAEMRRSNAAAARTLRQHCATAVTDVSGFGLLGHLGEMLAASGTDAELDLASVPLHGGALALARQGIASTLLPENMALLGLLAGHTDEVTRALLFDPQTAGGFLAGIPALEADACVAALRAAGVAAALIGSVTRAGIAARDVKATVRGKWDDAARA